MGGESRKPMSPGEDLASLPGIPAGAPLSVKEPEVDVAALAAVRERTAEEVATEAVRKSPFPKVKVRTAPTAEELAEVVADTVAALEGQSQHLALEHTSWDEAFSPADERDTGC